MIIVDLDTTVWVQRKVNILVILNIFMSDNSVEFAFKRLLRLCPDITLDNDAVKLIAEGDINQVIANHKRSNVIVGIDENESSTSTSDGDFTIVESVDNDYKTVEIDTNTADDSKSFDEYFPS